MDALSNPECEQWKVCIWFSIVASFDPQSVRVTGGDEMARKTPTARIYAGRHEAGTFLAAELPTEHGTTVVFDGSERHGLVEPICVGTITDRAFHLEGLKPEVVAQLDGEGIERLIAAVRRILRRTEGTAS